ncbi:MAG: sulfotransferase domain-containing protein [Patescibacteria group bacterium]|nr:sulfotransferase domain-containing protein [Patescibacteria group bacterium]
MTFKRSFKNSLLKILHPEFSTFEFAPLQPRSDDVYLASFPKSGNTWVAFLIGNAISLHLKLNMHANFFNIHLFVPDIHESRHIPAELSFPPFRRVIKTHAANNREYHNVLFLVRDPRDVMSSYYLYTKNQLIFDGSFSEFLRHEKYGIKAWAKHAESWLEQSGRHQNLQVFRYEDFAKEPKRELGRLFDVMGFQLSPDTLAKASELANFENMKKLETETYSYSIKRFDKFKFVARDQLAETVKLSEEDQKYLLEAAKPMMDKLGYQ